MKYEIRNRWNNTLIFSAAIEANERTPDGVKKGRAVLNAAGYGVSLRNADLRGLILRDTNVPAVDFIRADLRDADFTGSNFVDGYFNHADMTDACFAHTSMSYVIASGAKIHGADFYGADVTLCDFDYVKGVGSNFRHGDLYQTTFRGASLRGAIFEKTSLKDVDFSGSDLRQIVTGDTSYAIEENIHQKIYDAASAPGALDMRSPHSCMNTHSRAGWAVVLAGKNGKRLEDRCGTQAASALIYAMSDPKLKKIPDFYGGNVEALEDMKRLAYNEKRRNRRK
jgi:hypothetical protein